MCNDAIIAGLIRPEGAQRVKRSEGLARDRDRPLRTLVNAKEREVIEANAKATSLTVSAYLRAAAVGKRVFRVPNRSAVEALMKVNADQARLGNLLKLYLHEPDPDRATAGRLLGQIGDLQAELKTAVKLIME